MTTILEKIFGHARQLGVEITVIGPNNLRVIGPMTDEFRTELRANKAEVIRAILVVADAGLSPCQRAWAHVGRQFIEGEFAGADDSTLESLEIGLRTNPHPYAVEAVRGIRALRGIRR